MNKRTERLICYIFILTVIALFWVGFLKLKTLADDIKQANEQRYQEYEEIIEPEPIPAAAPAVDTQSLGTFRITYYTASVEECGNSKGVTRSGAHVTKGVTVAVDPSVIPLGSYIYIEGVGIRQAQDTGGAIKGNDIDVYVPNKSYIPPEGTHMASVHMLEVAQ